MKLYNKNDGEQPKDWNFFFDKLLLCLLCIVALCSESSLRAQTVSARAFADKNKILLGEPFWLTLEIKTVKNKNSGKPVFKIDSIPHFEFIIQDSVTTGQQGDTAIIRQYYQLTSFDSGKWVIPSFTLKPFVKTNSLLIDVVFTEDFDPRQPYHEVQEIKEVPFKMSADSEKWWYPAAALLILLALVIYWLTQKKKPRPPKKKIPAETAYKKALHSLKQLKERETDEKKYYAELIEIFRTYLLERTGISSMQQTSNNLIEKVKPLFPDKARYTALSQVLRLCDWVKFAKYHPDKKETGTAFDVIEGSVKYIEEELKNAAGK